MRRSLVLSLLCSIALGVLCACSPPPPTTSASNPDLPKEGEYTPVETIDKSVAEYVAITPELKGYAELVARHAEESGPLRNANSSEFVLVFAPESAALSKATTAPGAEDRLKALVVNSVRPLPGPTPVQKLGDSLVAAKGNLVMPSATGDLTLVGANPWRVRDTSGNEAKVKKIVTTKSGNIILVIDTLLEPGSPSALSP